MTRGRNTSPTARRADAPVERIDTSCEAGKFTALGCARAACRRVTRVLRHAGGGLFAAADFLDGVALWTEAVESGALADLEAYERGGESSIPCPVRGCGAGIGEPCTDRGSMLPAAHGERVDRWIGKVRADELGRALDGSLRADAHRRVVRGEIVAADGAQRVCKWCRSGSATHIDLTGAPACDDCADRCLYCGALAVESSPSRGFYCAAHAEAA